MKHGISPTTDRRVLKRRGKYIHVSKPLAIKETDWATGALKGIVSYDPDYLAPPNVRGEVIMPLSRDLRTGVLRTRSRPVGRTGAAVLRRRGGMVDEAF